MLINQFNDPKTKVADFMRQPESPISALPKMLERSAVFDLTDIGTAYDAHSERKGFLFHRDIYCARPPYDLMWAEFQSGIGRIGVLVEARHKVTREIPNDTLCSEVAKRDVSELRNGRVADVRTEVVQMFTGLTEVYCSVFCSISANQIIAFPRLVHCYVNPDGTPLTVPMSFRHPLTLPNSIASERETAEKLRHSLAADIHVIWFAFSLMACRNIVPIEHRAPRHERRQAERNGQVPPRNYYTLNVRLPGQYKASASSGQRGNEQGLLRLHQVRGHLADYRQGKGLFGKYNGVFWVPSHVRGNAERGTIHKSYSLTADI